MLPNGNSLSIVCNLSDDVATQAPVKWAVGQLSEALNAHGIDVQIHDSESEGELVQPSVIIAGASSTTAKEVLTASGVVVPETPESLGLVPGSVKGKSTLLACGSDTRGLVYALLELADRVAYYDDPIGALAVPDPIVEQPANRIRSIARLFTSEFEDKPWFYDKSFWQCYLTALITQRFNRFCLTLGLGYNFPRHVRDSYFYFAYPFLLTVPGCDVRAVGLPDEERDQNLEMLRFISDEAALRGLQFQLGLWTHAYEFVDSPDVNYAVKGLTPETHAPYCRDALRTLLEECPGICGVTFRIHGESGVPERSYDFWRTVFGGMVQCGREVEIDMHAKGLDQEMIDVALATGLRVNVSPKYWAEHQGLPYHQAWIREQELPPNKPDDGHMKLSGGSRRFLRYGYGDLLTEDRKYGVLYRIWPGTQRLLLWGDPAMAAGYGRYAHFCDSDGVELCEPLSFKGRADTGQPGGREGYLDASLRPAGGDWKKYLYTYRVFGRMLYNPEADANVWRRFLHKEFRAAASSVEEALASASRILPLATTAHCPSASNNAYWPEIYTNMPIVDEERPHPYGDTPEPKRFGTVSSLDPELFLSIEDLVDRAVRGERSAKISPLQVATWLDRLAIAAAENLKKAEEQVGDSSSASFRRMKIDVAIQSGLGSFFAHKLRAGVAYALFQRTKDLAALDGALAHYRSAREAWDELTEQAEVYAEDLAFGLRAHLRGHWADRLSAIDQDIADMEAVRGEVGADETPDDSSQGAVVRERLAQWETREEAFPCCEHTPPGSFVRGEPVPVELLVSDAASLDVRLCYRHVNQAEPHVEVQMEREDGCYRARIPATYTDSPYPLQYYFELRDGAGRAWLHPGFNETLSNQPYYVVRQK